jgi:hypothetical protein
VNVSLGLPVEVIKNPKESKSTPWRDGAVAAPVAPGRVVQLEFVASSCERGALLGGGAAGSVEL